MSSCAIAGLDDEKQVCMGILIKEIDEIVDCYKDLYKILTTDSYEDIEQLFERKTSTGNKCIPTLPEKMVIVTNDSRLVVETLCITRTKYLQKKDAQDRLLYFTNDPRIVKYVDNKITNDVTKYPVNYYIIKNRITPNYDYAYDVSGNISALYVDSDIHGYNFSTVIPKDTFACVYKNDNNIYCINLDDEKNDMISLIEQFILDITASKKLISKHIEN